MRPKLVSQAPGLMCDRVAASPLVNNRNLNREGSCVAVHFVSRCDTNTAQVLRAQTAAVDFFLMRAGL